jgi:hypothetical protein
MPLSFNETLMLLIEVSPSYHVLTVPSMTSPSLQLLENRSKELECEYKHIQYLMCETNRQRIFWETQLRISSHHQRVPRMVYQGIEDVKCVWEVLSDDLDRIFSMGVKIDQVISAVRALLE